MPFAPVHLVGPNQHDLLEAHPIVHCLHVTEEHPSHTRVILAEDHTDPHHWYLPHLGRSVYLELLAEMLAATLPKQGHRVHRAVVGAAPARQSTYNH